MCKDEYNDVKRLNDVSTVLLSKYYFLMIFA